MIALAIIGGVVVALVLAYGLNRILKEVRFEKSNIARTRAAEADANADSTTTTSTTEKE